MKAGSMSVGRFVAPKTTILSVDEFKPSQCLDDLMSKESAKRREARAYVMNSAFISAVTSWSPDDRSLKNESISSMKIMLGAVFLASENRAATSLFDSPNHLLLKDDTGMLMNVAPDSFARAFASIVFPQPGGPYNRTPRGAFKREEDMLKSSGCSKGTIIDSRNDRTILSSPPMSVQL